MADDHFLTVDLPCEGIYKEKGSKFLGYLFPVETEEQVKQYFLTLKKAHPSARHVCYAYRLGPAGERYRSNDDGEPSGTAGKPILNQLLSHQLTNCCLLVVRYFGGTLLGASGLINAYKTAAGDTLSQAKPVEKIVEEQFEIRFGYDLLGEVMRRIKTSGARIIWQKQEDECSVSLSIRRSEVSRIKSDLLKINNLVIAPPKNP